MYFDNFNKTTNDIVEAIKIQKIIYVKLISISKFCITLATPLLPTPIKITANIEKTSLDKIMLP